MKNQNTAVQKKDPSAIATVRSDLEKMKSQFALALPKHVTPDRLLRVALTCIQNTPKLLECDKTSLYAAIMTCAQLGLEPDGVLGHAYLIPYGNKVQFIPGYKGLLALARNSGEVISISAHEVREHDEFEYEYGLNEVLSHKPAHDERGEIVCFYAYAKFKDGGHHFDVMSLQEVEEIRDGDFEEQKTSGKLDGLVKNNKKDSIDRNQENGFISLDDRVNSMCADILMDKECAGTGDYRDVTNTDEFKALWTEVKASGDKDLLNKISSVMA